MLCVRPNSQYDYQTYLYCRDNSGNNIIQLYSTDANVTYSTNMVLYVLLATGRVV